jgi:putative CocE/NonD family hydrolase
MIRLLGWVGAAVGILLGAAVLLVVVMIGGAGIAYDLRAPARTVGGDLQDVAQYVTMSDGVRIAVDVFLPPHMQAGAKVPVLIKATPYWRGYRLGFLGKALVELHAIPAPDEPDPPVLTARGYAVMAVDTRGTGASFGSQKIAFDDRELKDYDELISWAARQPWSNGRVGAYGFSYRGMLATQMAGLGNPALKAIAPSFDFTDLYLVLYPGGVFDSYFAKAWGDQTGLLNRGVVPCPGWVCHLVVAGPKPVDADRDGALLARAIAGHAANYNMTACSRAAPDRDDRVCASGKSLSDVSELAHKAAIEAGHLPIYVEVGYFDQSSPAEALRRFQTFSNPQVLVIGPISHGGFQSTDPFRPGQTFADPNLGVQLTRMADFFDRYLMGPPPAPPANSVTYYVLNGGAWRTAATWPPPASRDQAWYFQAGHGLAVTSPTEPDGADAYAVDFNASSGVLARYRSPVDLSKTAYPDRADQDRQLATYTSAPAGAPIEIAGDPVAHLVLASSRPDGEVIVYLEDVAPNGAVTYLTEGLIRLAHRKAAAPNDAALTSDPLHSYLARDASPMTPGKTERVDIALSPIAALIRQGHSLRIAIAGADAGNLERLPVSGDETLTLERNARAASYVTLPVVVGR